ncbi:MAG: energy transducer TonB [Bacteroidota bacterium]
MPTFPGGQAALVEYMVQHLKYPTAAWEAKKEGRVVIKFTVSRSGAIRKAHVAKGMGYGMDAEALRVVKAMPNWNPAEKDGKVVAVEVSLPVQFALPK